MFQWICTPLSPPTHTPSSTVCFFSIFSSSSLFFRLPFFQCVLWISTAFITKNNNKKHWIAFRTFSQLSDFHIKLIQNLWLLHWNYNITISSEKLTFPCIPPLVILSWPGAVKPSGQAFQFYYPDPFQQLVTQLSISFTLCCDKVCSPT